MLYFYHPAFNAYGPCFKASQGEFCYHSYHQKADKKKSTATTKKTQKTAKKAASKSTTKSKTASSVKKSSITASKNAKTRSKHAVNKTASASFTEKCTKRKGYKSHCVKVKNAASGTLADAHKAKVQKATKVAMNKLMQQIGKPYRWGGSSPRTGFDCSGLVYYAYKDLVKIRIPRTANEMYHLRDAAPIERSELKTATWSFSVLRDAAQPIMSACMSATANLFSHRAQVRKFKSLLSVKTTGSATMLALVG